MSSNKQTKPIKKRPKQNKSLQLNQVKDELKRKVRFFVTRRYDFILLLMTVGYFNLSSNLEDVIDSNVRKDEQIKLLASYTTYITDSGVIKQYEKEQFDVYKEQDNVARVLSHYLVKSAFDLTDNFKRSFYSNEEELFKSTPDFVEFYVNYIQVDKHVTTEEQLKGFKQAKNDWQQIIRWFRSSIHNNDLPHQMDKKESDIKFLVWETHGSDFKIVFTIPSYAISRNKNDVIDRGIATATITATGYYDLQQKSTVNAYGMKFTGLTLNHPTINQKLVSGPKE